MPNQIKICLIHGFGFEVNYKVEHCLKSFGTEIDKVHLNELISNNKNLSDYHMIVLSDNFNYNNDVYNNVFEAKFKNYLMDELKRFIKDDKLVLGIGHGFNVLLRIGVLHDTESGQTSTLCHNSHKLFEPKLLTFLVNKKSPCIFTKGLNKLNLPICTKKGRFLAKDALVLRNLEKNNLIVLKYSDDKGKISTNPSDNATGSANSVAGICDKSGRVFGLIAHPESLIHLTDYPRLQSLKKILEDEEGIKIFQNAINYINSKLIKK